ncbi:hypothetical protein [Bradyrhizobium sp. AS23.2]|uniref:hypothetical protein n=1 Tax=Bradyrhizobium sp. AS23.2 TaxID=1680155 RepID=UPI00093F677E|nr:hypothetical protein [Bradyrhizobium sp. AS23.2]OKO76012.1 hypothetical protein AC630_23465 [Bradyrhizobium sp. AS23.2]
MSSFAVGRRRTGRATVLLWILVGFGLIVILAANAHLVYVATMSQPDCVSHLRRDETGPVALAYRAAQSACSPSALDNTTRGNKR